MKRNRIAKTKTTLIQHFIAFSLLAVLVFFIASTVFDELCSNFIMSGSQNFFVKEGDEGLEVDRRKVEAAGGFYAVLDSDLNMVENDCAPGIDSLDINDIFNLASGDYSYGGEKYVGSFASYETGTGKLFLLVATPTRTIKVTYTLSNVPGPDALSLLLFFLLSTGIFATGYIAVLADMARRLNNQIVSPILAIAKALEALGSDEYNISLDFKAQNEFVFIKNAFEQMLVRLHDAEEQRRDRQQEKIRLLSDIGHDLRTPLTIIKGLLQALLFKSNVDEQTRQGYLETIYRNTGTISELIEMQLDYALGERQDYRIPMENENLCECIREIVIANFPLMDSAGIELDVDMPDADVFCNMNRGQIHRAFNNILSNAIFHNNDVADMKIKIKVSLGGDSIIVVFADSGKAIPESTKSTLFTALAPKETASSGSGRGLGLSISQKIVEQHGGRIGLEEKLEEGFEGYSKAFVIELPCGRQADQSDGSSPCSLSPAAL